MNFPTLNYRYAEKLVKAVLCILFMGFFLKVACQTNGQTQFQGPSIFIKGHQYEEYISIDTMSKGFELELSDSSYKIDSYYMSWNDEENIYRVKSQNSRFSNRIAMGFSNGTVKSSIFVFDEIVISKGGKQYHLPSFIVYAESTEKIKAINTPLAGITAYIPGLEQSSYADASIFLKSFPLMLTDDSYTITNFVVTITLDGGRTYAFHFKGSVFRHWEYGLAEVVKKLNNKSLVQISPIHVQNATDNYTVKGLEFHIK